MVSVVVSPTTIWRSILGLAAVLLAVGATAIMTRAQPAPLAATSVPGALSDGTTLLANGWRLAPAGRHLKTGSLPLNLLVSPDGRYAITTNNGINRPSFTVIDIVLPHHTTQTLRITRRERCPAGLARCLRLILRRRRHRRSSPCFRATRAAAAAQAPSGLPGTPRDRDASCCR